MGREVPIRFLLDVHLGRLARYLRLLGFDAAWETGLDDPTLARRARDEERVLLSRDRGLLRRSAVTSGYRVEATDPRRQIEEVVERFGLAPCARPFRRCLVCNLPLRRVSREEVVDELPPVTRSEQERFRRCPGCRRVYWPGSHYRRMRGLVEQLLGKRSDGG